MDHHCRRLVCEAEILPEACNPQKNPRLRQQMAVERKAGSSLKNQREKGRKYMPTIKRFAAKCLASASTIALGAAIASTPVLAGSPFIHTHYDGVSDDLLTAGLGASGLGVATPPAFADPLNPTTAELRRYAIYNNYRALVDPTSGGGYGLLYGPNVTAGGVVTTGQGLIAGDEYIGYQITLNSLAPVTIVVQIPDSFNPAASCIVAAPSSGSRGVYGAIATAGEWGLKHGCAVAYTDKGSGTGADDLQNDTVNLLQGERAGSAAAGDKSNFSALLSYGARTAFNAATPNRFAFKHAHSRLNPEKDWGRNVLSAIKAAFDILNQKYAGSGVTFTKQNTIVIASSVSNGGGASVRAVEEDDAHLIDGLAVGEPNVNPVYSDKFTIVQGGGAPFAAHSKPLIDYITLVNVFQGCASVGYPAGLPFLNLAASPGRCASLQSKGLLSSSTLAAQAAEAQSIINSYGILPEQNQVQTGYWYAYVPQSISVTYANAYSRSSAIDNLCSFSFAATASGAPAPLAAATEAQIFGASNGIPPTTGISLINNVASKEDRISTPDQNLDGALCLRSLALGKDAVTGAPLSGAAAAQASIIAGSVKQIQATGRLHGVPAIFVTGRNDGILPPNFASRAYFGLNNTEEGAHSSVHYYEVTNAHHLDNFNQYPGYNASFIPLHRYFLQAMDLMYAHLRKGTPLPPSQVVHTTPRGAGPPVPAITSADVPPISAAPPASAKITFTSGQVRIPD
jgi:hydroxybutyrate-dimer hydrolase